LEPVKIKTEELSSTKAHMAVHEHKTDVEALEVQLKREQMQLLELLTQASGGRTEDSQHRKGSAAEVVNRSENTSFELHNPNQDSLVSPRSNPFLTPADASRVMSTSPRSNTLKIASFGGAVSTGAPGPTKGVIPSAAMFEATKKPAPRAGGMAPAKVNNKSPRGVSPTATSFKAPSKSGAVAVKGRAAPKSGPGPAKAKSAPAAKSPFNPFGAVAKSVPSKGRQMPPPPKGANPNANRAVPPPPTAK
jgi:hypothetical protein